MGTIRKRGDRYQVQIRRAGFPPQNRSFRTRKLAEQWNRVTEADMDRGTFLDLTVARTTTFADVLIHYRETVTQFRRKEQSRRDELSRIKRLLKHEIELCAITMDRLKPHHIEDLRDRRRRQPSPYKTHADGSPKRIAASTIKRELSLIHCAIEKSMGRLELARNVACGKLVKRPKVKDERLVVWSDTDIAIILEECYKLRNPLIGPFLELLFEVGARRGALIRLLWDDVCIDLRTAILRDVKNTQSPDEVKDRVILLSGHALDLLSHLPRTDARVFPMTANAYKLAFQRARNNAAKRDPRLQAFRSHDARHDFCSRMAENDWSVPQMMTLSGHEDVRSLKRYVTLKPEQLMEKFSNLPSRSYGAHSDSSGKLVAR
jgi:integrase